MNQYEEISLLDIQLQSEPDVVRQAEIVLSILDRHHYLKSRSTAPYTEKLRLLNGMLRSPLYAAWILFYEGTEHYFAMDYAASVESLGIALEQFDSLNQQTGATECLLQLAWNDYIQDRYTSGLDYAAKAAGRAEAASYHRGLSAAYNTIGLIYWNQGDFPNALEYHQRSLALKEKANDKPGMASSYNNIGLIYSNQGDIKQALEYHFKSLHIKEDLNDKRGIAGSYGNIGNIYEMQGNYPQALAYLLKGLEIHEARDDRRRMASAYHNIGNIYRNQANYTLALQYDQQSLAMATDSGDRSLQAMCHNNIGLIYSLQNMNSEALAHLLKSLMILEDSGNKLEVAETCYNIGVVGYHLGEQESALEYASQALTIATDIDAKEHIAKIKCLKGNIYTATGDFDRAAPNLREALETATEMGFRKEQRDALKGTFELRKAQGDWQGALEYYQQYIEVKEDVLNADTQKQIMSMQFAYDMEQKEKEVEIHRLRTVELRAEKDRSDALLLNILPAGVAEELKATDTCEPRHFKNVSVLFSDFQNFTGFSEKMTPKELVSELHTCFKAFDDILGRYNIEKIKTVGDGYLAAAGVPVPNANHAEDMVRCAVEIRDYMSERRKELGEGTFEVRIGIDSGHVVAGIVGVKKFSYDIWGDTVNTAARMEQNSEPGKINISGATYALIKDKLPCTHRGKIMAKNKGEVDMYFVNE